MLVFFRLKWYVQMKCVYIYMAKMFWHINYKMENLEIKKCNQVFGGFWVIRNFNVVVPKLPLNGWKLDGVIPKLTIVFPLSFPNHLDTIRAGHWSV